MGGDGGKGFGRFKAYSTHQVGGDMVGRRGRWVGIRVVYGIIISSGGWGWFEGRMCVGIWVV